MWELGFESWQSGFRIGVLNLYPLLTPELTTRNLQTNSSERNTLLWRFDNQSDSSHLSNSILYYSSASISVARSKNFFNNSACTALNLYLSETSPQISFVLVLPNKIISILQYLSQGPILSKAFLKGFQPQQASLPTELLLHFQFTMIFFFFLKHSMGLISNKVNINCYNSCDQKVLWGSFFWQSKVLLDQKVRKPLWISPDPMIASFLALTS